ncbi:hypothetical protein Ddc_21996 [Ditylenchus destructor]|nr:hypothetical protein Ddc_21996 [Ditylenchus destructor]
MSNQIVSFPYMDHDAQCSTDQDTFTKMCVCRSPRAAEKYCSKVKNEKYGGVQEEREYHVFGEVYNQMYESYNFYTSIFPPDEYLDIDYSFWCNMPIRTSPQSRYNSSQISAAFGSNNSWPEDMCKSSSHKFIQRKYISALEVDFFLPDMESETERHIFPVDVTRWSRKLIEGDCVIVQTSAFSRYCFCAGKNKSESFCRLSTDGLKLDSIDNGQNGADSHESKNDDSSDTENGNDTDDIDSSKKFPTIQVPLENIVDLLQTEKWWMPQQIQPKAKKEPIPESNLSKQAMKTTGRR